MDEFRRAHGGLAPLYVGPKISERLRVCLKLFSAHALTDSADNEPFPRAAKTLCKAAKALPFFFVGDPSRDTRVVAPGQVDEKATRKSDLGRETSALGAHRVLARLHQYFLARL